MLVSVRRGNVRSRRSDEAIRRGERFDWLGVDAESDVELTVEAERPRDVSVVISSYSDGRWRELAAAVESVVSQTHPPLEVLVVVDHNDRLLERVGCELGDVVALPNGGPQGLSAARNTGVAAAKAEVAAFLDDDAIAEPEWLERLLIAYDADVLGVGGAVIPLWETRRPSWFPEEFDWVVGCTYEGLPQVPSQVRNLIGANMSFRRELVDEVGGFASDFGRVSHTPTGCEETELCIRMRERWPDRHFVYDPRVRVKHRVPETRGRVSYFAARCHAEGRSKAILARRHGATLALATERAYVRQTLRAAVVSGVHDALRGSPEGALQSAAILFGFTITAAGYVGGRLRRLASVTGR